jgi:hypothetical protein
VEFRISHRVAAAVSNASLQSEVQNLVQPASDWKLLSGCYICVSSPAVFLCLKGRTLRHVCGGKGTLLPLQHAGWKEGSAHTMCGSHHLKISPLGTFLCLNEVHCKYALWPIWASQHPWYNLDCNLQRHHCHSVHKHWGRISVGAVMHPCLEAGHSNCSSSMLHASCTVGPQSHKEPVTTHFM